MFIGNCLNKLNKKNLKSTSTLSRFQKWQQHISINNRNTQIDYFYSFIGQTE